MGSKQIGSKCNKSDKVPTNIKQVVDFTSQDKYTLENLNLCTVTGIQIGINSSIDKDIIKENNNDKNVVDSSAPPVINFNQGNSGVLPDIDEIGINNYAQCFCFLEVEELKKKSEGIIIEFGEYAFGNPNDFGVEKTFYPSKKGGLRLYVVNLQTFENNCRLARIKCKIYKNEILEDILYGISKEHKWRFEFYDRKTQNSSDFAAVLLDYLQILNYEICKGSDDDIPNKLLSVLDK